MEQKPPERASFYDKLVYPHPDTHVAQIVTFTPIPTNRGDEVKFTITSPGRRR